MTAHPIRYDKKAAVLVGIGEKAVLVSLPDTPDVRAGGDREMH